MCWSGACVSVTGMQVSLLPGGCLPPRDPHEQWRHHLQRDPAPVTAAPMSRRMSPKYDAFGPVIAGK